MPKPEFASLPPGYPVKHSTKGCNHKWKNIVACCRCGAKGSECCKCGEMLVEDCICTEPPREEGDFLSW